MYIFLLKEPNVCLKKLFTGLIWKNSSKWCKNDYSCAIKSIPFCKFLDCIWTIINEVIGTLPYEQSKHSILDTQWSIQLFFKKISGYFIYFEKKVGTKSLPLYHLQGQTNKTLNALERVTRKYLLKHVIHHKNYIL